MASYSCPTVVAQAYKVDVEVLGASRGCTAILRCVVPTFVKELVRVVSWVQEPALYIYPSLQGGNNHGHAVALVRLVVCGCVCAFGTMEDIFLSLCVRDANVECDSEREQIGMRDVT